MFPWSKNGFPSRQVVQDEPGTRYDFPINWHAACDSPEI
jgi:hypothetical protein